jgi:hypothetical protein
VGNTIDPDTGLTRELPWIYSEVRLCRDVYHCRPSELDEEEFERIQMHIAIMNLEAEAEALKRKHTAS